MTSNQLTILGYVAALFSFMFDKGSSGHMVFLFLGLGFFVTSIIKRIRK